MRKLAAFSAAFSAGVFAARYLLPWEWQPAGCAAMLLLALTGFLLRGHGRLRMVLICGGAAAALCWNWTYESLARFPAEQLAGTVRTAVLVTEDYPEETTAGVRVPVRLKGEGVRVLYYGDSSLMGLPPGSAVSGPLEFRPLPQTEDKSAERSFAARGIFLLAVSGGETVTGRDSVGSPRWWPVELKQALSRRIALLFPGDEGAFLTALFTGEKGALPEKRCTDLTQAGMLHLLAVSGLHCGFLLALLQGIVGKHRRRLLAALGVPLLAFYALMTGGTPSVVRAAVVLTFLLLAPVFGRDSDPPTALLTALMLLLLWNPCAAWSVSLQLSFAAAAGILWLAPGLLRLLTRGSANRLRQAVASGLSVTFGALAFTAPLSAFWFGMLPLVSPLSNLLCLPVMGVIFASGLLALGLSVVWFPLGALAGAVPAALIRYVLWAAEMLAGLRYHAVYFTNPYLKYWLAGTYVLLGLAWALKKLPAVKYPAAAAVSLAALTAAVRLGTVRSAAGMLEFTALDVGQGQCLMVASAGEFALIDCGSGNAWYDPGNLAADALQSAGCFRLDKLFLTHYDTDHISGVTGLLDRMEVACIVAPEEKDDDGLQAALLQAAADHGTAVETTRMRVLQYTLGEAEITVYPPLGERDDNERGLTVLVSAGGQDILVTGDMDRETERLLLQHVELPDLEVLVAGHHGAENSTSPELLYVTMPERVVISVGSNAYGHPAAETLERIERCGGEVLRTDLLGDIHISLN
ncbi:DNA internalization-related competence protein ComEC/Rec2 [Dysosmobacter sp.]|uniref:DNA internalization-related competence protein ComEC/Rec2 n=1 Tax=Dysosmobacter sp. TaxID=2591382 RepID=UPI002A8897E6|nr:DNA internalization-related competence protein ComEC/Rec2 [Dysosmobacter sp.]MDY3281281.1 DNA internalization-related competence protein ComEC/Rec2 [Dysosmobacter sp.]